jgi:hypothetical protein
MMVRDSLLAVSRRQGSTLLMLIQPNRTSEEAFTHLNSS